VEKQTKTSYFLLAVAVASSILHNLIYGLFGVEEPVFFALALLLFFAFLASIIYNLYTYKKRGEPKDLWKLGWLGLLGWLGFFSRFGPRLYGFYGFFGFFGLKREKK